MNLYSWEDEWKAIAGRIEGLSMAGEMYFKSKDTHEQDPSDTMRKVFFPQTFDIFVLIKKKYSEYLDQLPKLACECIERFIHIQNQNFTFHVTSLTLSAQVQLAISRLTALISFKAELEYHFSSISDQIRHITERAFEHLQRCIIADHSYKEKWTSAFTQNETYCEKLGAVHLLWHGIWSFKVNAEGGRTDLVYGDIIDNPTQVKDAIGLVLTEWKKANSRAETKKRIMEAQKQAALYSVGVLGGVELSSPRYLVIVTKNFIDLPTDTEIENIKYRHINIATNPSTPSVASKKDA